MNAIYHIKGLCPRTDISLGRCGFCIDLHPSWEVAVSNCELNQDIVNVGVKNMHRLWLDACGYNQIFDPYNSGFDRDENKKPGPRATPLYGEHAIRVIWGKWGPEHITVPGNACGLDIDRSFGGWMGGRSLVPHNVDTIAQAHLLLVVFTFFADTLILQEQSEAPAQTV